jgi:Tol biopolymer transport system component
MNPSISRQGRQKVFAWVVLGCIALAVGYTSWVIQRDDTSSNHAQSQGQAQSVPQPVARPEELEAIQKGPHLLFLHQVGPHYGQVTLTGFEPALRQHAQTTLACDRVHYAAGNGLCLIYDTSAPPEDLLAPIPVGVTLFGPDLQPRHHFTVEGIPSRTRVSPDGKYAAFTVFVAGHSYMDMHMSTATVLLDTATGTSLGNLEEFETWKDGRLYEAPEFNFWGVTFAQDSNRFYATLRNGTTTYLVQGDIAARKLTVLHENVECPSLSPDGTRIAFKRLTGNRWQLAVLDLATMQETELAEKEGIDDQVEWLDNERILYQKADYDPPKWVSVFVIPADGSGQPEVFIENATSPVVVR